MMGGLQTNIPGMTTGQAWVTDENKKKLPNDKRSRRRGEKQKVKFGIWIELKCKSESELREKHPEWILNCQTPGTLFPQPDGPRPHQSQRAGFCFWSRR